VTPIYILTKNRLDRQITWESLSPRARERVTFVCPADEAKHFSSALVEPEGVRIAAKRQFVFEHALASGIQQIVVMDDDLKFFKRGPNGKPQRCTADDVDAMLAHLDNLLEDFVLVGINMRFMSQGRTATYEVGSKQMCVHAMNVGYLAKLVSPKYVCEVCEDIDFTLQVLRAGLPNAVSNLYMHDQKSQAPGGCADWRTQQVYEDALKHLAARHPEFVKLRVCEAKPQSGVMTTLRPTIQYKKALAAGGYQT
jgi:hypothetical protein